MKPIQFHPAALDAIREFPRQARRDVGQALLDLQHGASIGMPMSRPMPSIGAGVHELRVRDRSGIVRVFYAVKFGSGILVFHAFVKKSSKTPDHEIALGKKRLKEMQR